MEGTKVFQIKTHEDTRRTMERAYVLHLSGDRMLIFTGNVARLTAKRKAVMYRIAYEVARLEAFPGTDMQAVEAFDRHAFSRWDNVELVHRTITSDDGETWGELSYTHGRGFGSRTLANVYQYTVNV